MKKQCIGMLLAGGQGSRLGSLTGKYTKPLVPFGGRYRLIDFTLSNCSNSGIDTVGVLTQYQPTLLNSYISTGSPWNLDRFNGGVTLLPPYGKTYEGEWYDGTAEALYQNLNYLDEYSPEYVLILPGDHIYNMDYSLMLDYHKRKNGVLTIAVTRVTPKEAHGFGVMTTDGECRVIEFEDKPIKPKSVLASMEIYIFNYRFLKERLIEDHNDVNSSHNFSKDLIPAMVRDNKSVYSYSFNGYWKDVETVEGYYEANMDLLKNPSALELYSSRWKVYTTNSLQPPHYVSSQCCIINSMINEGCRIFGHVENSILFEGAYVGEGAVIKNSIIFPRAYIGTGVIMNRAIVGEECIVRENKIVDSEYGAKKSLGCEVHSGDIVVLEGNMVY